MPTWRSG